MYQLSLTSSSKVFGMLHSLVRKRFLWRERVPERLPLTSSSTIHLLPGQASVMKPGLCVAQSAQVVSRP
jgi:hypothetical protein